MLQLCTTLLLDGVRYSLPDLYTCLTNVQALEHIQALLTSHTTPVFASNSGHQEEDPVDAPASVEVGPPAVARGDALPT